MMSDDLARKRMWRTFIEHAQPVLEDWQDMFARPDQAQERVLQRILTYNTDSAFGRAHEFASITDASMFADKVPIHSYADLRPWIERAQNEHGAVLTGSPPLFFERTSGNSARQKNIPYTRAFLSELQKALTVWLADLYCRLPEIGHGMSYWSMSPPLQSPGISANGIPVGSTSDLAYLEGSALTGLAGTLLIPDLSESASEWRKRTLLALLSNADLSFISVWSPTFLISLLQPVFDVEMAESRRTFEWLEGALPASRKRALQRARDQGDFTGLWPRLAAISCWMDGPSCNYAMQLATRFPHVQCLPKGLFATEGVVSVPFGEGAGCPLAIGSHYLEFLAEDGSLRSARTLRIGETAQVLLTTGGGLYRYALGDRVRGVGMIGDTARVEFVGRATGSCDLVGEKLDEPLVERALSGCINAGDSACLVPDTRATPARYVLVIATFACLDAKTLAGSVDAALQQSFHYAHARRMGQLGPVGVRVVGGGTDTLAQYLQRAAELAGIRAGDVKPRSLISQIKTAEALLAVTEPLECQTS